MAKADMARSRARFAPFLLPLLLALTATTACDDKVPTNLVSQKPNALQRVVGVAEVTFHDLNTPAISATIRLGTSIADLDQLRANPAAANTLTTIRLDLITVGEFLDTPAGGPDTRNIHATFGLSNTQVGTLVFDPARENLAFVPVQTTATIPGTPFSALRKADGSTVSNPFAHQVTATALTALDEVGKIVTVDDRTLQPLNNPGIQNTTGAQHIFPFGFVVLRPPVVAGFPPSPFAGVVTFAFQLPEAAQAADNPTTMSVLFLIVDDATATSH